MDVFTWIEQTLDPKACDSTEFMYDDMESQSDYCLPLIYQPFDAGIKGHWCDRGSLFDYLFSMDGEGKVLLDFGPGDGWPSLIVAPFVHQVIGVDGSQRRVEVCTENAERMNISNARFVWTQPGGPLQFEDESFDGVMAASSVEQTPNPKGVLQEFYRVLKPGGRLRISYEALGRYRGGQEQEVWVAGINDQTCDLTLYDRHIDQEYARMYKVAFAIPCEELIEFFAEGESTLSFDAVSVASLEKVRKHAVGARLCTLTHPSGRTFVSWLKEVGFREIMPTHRGAWVAARMFDQFPEGRRPKEIEGVDALLRPVVGIAVELAAPIDMDPMITAVK